ncbi:hypothetical protein BV378_01280 [Nostoc sp. RF31YmG]|nr:hypothetical protein BV378_01280 [Nostoc sp. RF31YmG]
MKGDFSRFSFNPQKRFSRVLMQQGRVQLDADWNEQLDITEHRIAAEITDFIGQSGAPEKSAGFEITADDKTNLKIGEGRYYVEGMLFENDQSVLFTAQSDYPGAKLPTEEGIYLAYLDVWQRHITALEDPGIREPALGGADTATRVKNVWQVKLKKVDSADKSKYAPPDWKPSWENPISTGKLSAILGAGANLENQLYRVEIHKSGKVGDADATFKWSRDNGSIATRVENKITDNYIPVSRLGQDIQTAFAAGNWVEITTEKQTLSGEPGLLVELASVTANTLTVKEWPGGKAPDFEPPMIVRRWDSGEISVSDSWKTLESEIKVRFENQLQDKQSSAEYKTGDYWLIPTRNLTANNESPSNKPQPPHGILHRYCSLALVEYKGGQFTVKDDCRVIFKPLTTGLLSKGGDTMTGSLTIDKDLYVAGNVGIGFDSSSISYYFQNSNSTKLFVKSKSPNVNNSRQNLAPPESVLALIRDGVTNETYGNMADFRLSRYDASDTNSTDSRTQLDLWLTDGSFVPKNIMTLRANGNVGISTNNPQSKLAVSGGVAIGSTYAGTNAVPANGLLVEGNVAIGGKIGEGRITRIDNEVSSFKISIELTSGSELYLLPVIVPKGHDSLTISITKKGNSWGSSSDWTIGCLFGTVVGYSVSQGKAVLNTCQVYSMAEQDNKWIININLPGEMIDNSYGIFIIIGRYKLEK